MTRPAVQSLLCAESNRWHQGCLAVQSQRASQGVMRHNSWKKYERRVSTLIFHPFVPSFQVPLRSFAGPRHNELSVLLGKGCPCLFTECPDRTCLHVHLIRLESRLHQDFLCCLVHVISFACGTNTKDLFVPSFMKHSEDGVQVSLRQFFPLSVLTW